jgi:hypothetical protein
MVFDGSDTVTELCSSPRGLTLLNCLKNIRGKLITKADVQSCSLDTPSPHSLKIKRIFGQHGAPYVTTGQRFGFEGDLYDQWDGKIEDGYHVPREGWLVSISVNENNEQGAVLWGTRSNRTSQGIVYFDNLVINKPGKIEVKVQLFNTILTRDSSLPLSETLKVTLTVFTLIVHEDPDQIGAFTCTFVFGVSMCSTGDDEEELAKAIFPRIRSIIDDSLFMSTVACSEILHQWNISTYITPNGDVLVEYRQGIDAVWTGYEYPTIEMSYEERLGLDRNLLGKNSNLSSKSIQKEIRRAYYKKSLLWHPDRWASMPFYVQAAQGAFEVVSEAYEQLSNKNTTFSPPL